MAWKNKANQHHVHKKIIHKPEPQAKKLLNRIHKPEAQAKRMVIILVINKNPSLALQAYINIKISVKIVKYD